MNQWMMMTPKQETSVKTSNWIFHAETQAATMQQSNKEGKIYQRIVAKNGNKGQCESEKFIIRNEQQILWKWHNYNLQELWGVSFLRVYWILHGLGPTTIPVKSASGKGSSISKSKFLIKTLQIVFICRIANCWPMHAWRPPPKPRYENGRALSSSLGGAKRSGW